MTGTPGIGKSFFAPILARFIMNDDEHAIIAYWRANSLYIFSKTSLVGIPGLQYEEPKELVGEGAAFHDCQIPGPGESQRAVLEQMSRDNAIRLYIIRDPPRLAQDDKAGDMNELQGAEMRVVLASNGSPLIAQLKSKGEAHFYYVQPWPMEHIEAAFSARLISVVSGETKADGQPVESHAGISVAGSGSAEEKKADSELVRAAYENAAAAINANQSDATALSAEENARLEVLRRRCGEAGGNLRLLLFSEDKYLVAVKAMEVKLKIFFDAPASNIPSGPSFVDNDRFYGTILHVVPTEEPTDGSPLGLVHATMKWASPYVENLAINQVLQNAHEFADRFATVLGGSGSQGTYTGVFEGQCHRDLASGTPLKRKLKVLAPPGVHMP